MVSLCKVCFDVSVKVAAIVVLCKSSHHDVIIMVQSLGVVLTMTSCGLIKLPTSGVISYTHSYSHSVVLGK